MGASRRHLQGPDVEQQNSSTDRFINQAFISVGAAVCLFLFFLEKQSDVAHSATMTSFVALFDEPSATQDVLHVSWNSVSSYTGGFSLCMSMVFKKTLLCETMCE
jgi:hypothetical protein